MAAGGQRFAGCALLVTLCVAVVVARRRTVISRWLHLHSALVDETLNVQLVHKLKPHVGAPNKMCALIGSSTMVGLGDRAAPFVNLGVNSLCTSHLCRHEALLTRIPFDAVVLYVGVNDMIRGATSSDIQRNVMRIVDAVGASRLCYVTVVQSPYQRSLGRQRVQHIDRVNADLEQTLLFRPNVSVVTCAFDHAAHFQSDGLHLNDAGNARLLRHLNHFMEDALH